MAILAIPGRDIIRVTDQDYLNDEPNLDSKVHIIRLDFNSPNDTKMRWVIDKFYKTNRFVVDLQNIKYYNFYLKRTNYKYYVINTNVLWKGLISFYKRNNKVLLDITKLTRQEQNFVLNIAFEDVLNNTEVILLEEIQYIDKFDIIKKWKGNCIINDPKYKI